MNPKSRNPKKNSPHLEKMPSESSTTAEETRLAEDRARARNWKRWGRACPNANGRPCAKIMLAAASIAGAKTDCWGLLTGSAGSVLVWLMEWA
jgi:hypothetical protein